MAAAWVVTLVFSYLDTWFLRQERMYRTLFNRLQAQAVGATRADLDMNASPYARDAPWWRVFWSVTIAPMYLTLAWGTGLLAVSWAEDAGAPAAVGACLGGSSWWCARTVVVLGPVLLHTLIVPGVMRLFTGKW